MPHVTVEVGLGEFDTEDLVEELTGRGRVVLPDRATESGQLQHVLLERLYYGLSGNDQAVINEAARGLCDLLGDRIL